MHIGSHTHQLHHATGTAKTASPFSSANASTDPSAGTDPLLNATASSSSPGTDATNSAASPFGNLSSSLQTLLLHLSPNATTAPGDAAQAYAASVN